MMNRVRNIISTVVLVLALVGVSFAAEKQELQSLEDQPLAWQAADNFCDDFGGHINCCVASLTHCNVFPPVSAALKAYDVASLSKSSFMLDDMPLSGYIEELTTPPPRSAEIS